MESLRNAGAVEKDVGEDYDEDDYDEESEENESDDEDPEPNLRYSEINLHEVNGFQEYMEQNITGMEN
jgi:TATA-binding protein-associated factor Taf7